jgi:cytochrome c oxidase subunit 5a
MSKRNLNNAFAYDLVPSPSVITAALHAARRVNDFPTAVRIFEGRLPTDSPGHLQS